MNEVFMNKLADTFESQISWVTFVMIPPQICIVNRNVKHFCSSVKSSCLNVIEIDSPYLMIHFLAERG